MHAFERTLKKMLYVKYKSSPTAKIEEISKFFAEIVPGKGQQAADFVLNLLIYAMVCVGKKSAELCLEH